MSTAALLRQRLAETEPLVVPGAANALAARIIELSGFRAAYVTGAGVANSFLGAPDVGLVTASELAAHVGAIAEATPGLPVMVDADTGFGNAINVQRTVRSLERAGRGGNPARGPGRAEEVRALHREDVGPSRGDGEQDRGRPRCSA